jgi:hypothetical protein
MRVADTFRGDGRFEQGTSPNGAERRVRHAACPTQRRPHRDAVPTNDPSTPEPVAPTPLPPTPQNPQGVPPPIDDPRGPADPAPVREPPTSHPPVVASR